MDFLNIKFHSFSTSNVREKIFKVLDQLKLRTKSSAESNTVLFRFNIGHCLIDD